MARRFAGWILGALGVLAAAPPAHAQAITDRDFAIDFYEGIAIGNTTQVGMGGAGAAFIIGSAGTLINASAPAVRATTDRDGWSWDYHLDALTATFSSDYDNNGIEAGDDGGASFLTLGLSLRFNNWAGAVTATAQTAPVLGSSPRLDAEAIRVKYVIAKWFPSYDIAVGAGVQQVRFRLVDGDQELFGISGAGLLAGMTWAPRQRDIRLAGAFESAILGGQVDVEGCDPMDCRGYILPGDVEAAARLIGGVAYRFGPTPWNSVILTHFRDERAVTVAADLVVTGATTNGYGIEAFGMQELQRSGRHVAVSPRAGVDFEALPGRLRVRAGSYWEPSRFDGVSGRLHGTFGVDLALFQFRLFGPRRVRVSGTGDIAPRYNNLGLSIGFWH